MAEHPEARESPSGPVDTRARILQIAADLFRERGYAGTSMRDISEQLGTSKAALYYHFPRKEDILQALVAPALAALDGVIAEAEAVPEADPAALLRGVVMATVQAGAGLGPLDLPDVVHDKDEGGAISSRMDRIAALLAGADADAPDLLRAHAAMGAVRGGMVAAVRLRQAALPAASAHAGLEDDLAAVIAAAVSALGTRRP